MSSIPAEVRQQVEARAGLRCEYCHIHQQWAFLKHHIDHIIAVKHRGSSELSNLALACADCNQAKGTDFGSFDESGEIVRYFHPRSQMWEDHFRLQSNGEFVGLTSVGRMTVLMLNINDEIRVLSRRDLIETGQW